MSLTLDQLTAALQARLLANTSALTRLTKKYIDFRNVCVCTTQSEQISEIDLMHTVEQLQKESVTYEFQVLKLQITSEVARLDINAIAHHLQELSDGIKSQNEQLHRLQYELEREKQLRRYRQEYDSIAGAIMELPDRSSQQNLTKTLQAELDFLAAQNEKLCTTLDLRNKQFSLLMRTVASLQESLDQEETDELLNRQVTASTETPTQNDNEEDVMDEDEKENNEPKRTESEVSTQVTETTTNNNQEANKTDSNKMDSTE
ncbi:THO complex subunit 7 [Acrasis kona]|uniref:THO complex subunit 7 n=1 Tax=Acrasis kona TaxID=1008807 RepID=A0AAW2ZIG1_9EUKA